MRYVKWLAILGIFGAGCTEGVDTPEAAAQLAQSPQAQSPTQSPSMTVAAAVAHDISGPLRDVPVRTVDRQRGERPIGRFRISGPEIDRDPVMQAAPVPSAPTVTGLNFAGLGNGDYGIDPNVAPPDTNGAVGTTQYVQWVNLTFAVFDKATGAIAPGFPKAGNAPWAGFNSPCATDNDGDPIVQFDKAAQRWILTQFRVRARPFLQCVAVSTTSDATGSYARYAFEYPDFPDYPKLSVWPDAYYISFNIFGSTFLGSLACAYDRAAMLAGAPANQICFGPLPSFASPLPSDLDGSTPPPAGSPAYFVNLQTTTSMNMFRFRVNFQNPSLSTFTGPTVLTVPSFAVACSNGPCIPQVDTRQRLDGLSDRLMYRLAYRNFGDHEAMVVTHSVSTGRRNPSGVRWYELRSPGNGNFSLFQSGTFAPDGLFRWMGSAAMDKLGNMAVGYSLSSDTTHPALGYATRTPTDPAGTLGNEVIFRQGAGSQLSNLSRWGDYSAMTIDPVDDCTFWFTSEYLKANGTFNWSTQITSFRVASCQ